MFVDDKMIMNDNNTEDHIKFQVPLIILISYRERSKVPFFGDELVVLQGRMIQDHPKTRQVSLFQRQIIVNTWCTLAYGKEMHRNSQVAPKNMPFLHEKKVYLNKGHFNHPHSTVLHVH